MKKKKLKRVLSSFIAFMMVVSMTAASQTGAFAPITVSAADEAAPEIVNSGTIGGASYTIDSKGALVVTGASVVLEDGVFADKGLTSVDIDATSVKVHPHAFTGNEELAAFTFSSSEPVTIEGVVEGLTADALVTIPLYSKKYTPAGKKFNYTEYSLENAAKRDDLQSRYDAAAYLWEDTSAILAEADADEFITVSDTDPSSEELTKNNWSTTFPNAQVQHFGTMAGLGTMADPYRIENTDNWRYLAYMTEKSMLSGSYYGQDRGTYVKLTADLTLSDKDGTFVPLGGCFTYMDHPGYPNGYTVSRAYVGNFDGDGHTITLDVTNLDNPDSTEGFGLFAKTDCPYIKNLNISGQVISNEVKTGLFIGGAGSWDYLYNCSSDATLILRGSGDFKSGAFVGHSYRPTVENCHFTGSIIGDDPSIPDDRDDGTTITAVGGFVGEFSGSDGGESMKNCYFAPSEIKVGSIGSAMLYRPYYGSYSGYCGFKEAENNYHNSAALKLDGADMGDLDQGMSDSDGIDSLNLTEFWENGALALPRAEVQANPGTTTFVYTGGAHRLINDIQAERSYSTGKGINEWDNFPYMPGYGKNGYVVYKVNDGEWSATPPTATEVGDYTVYYRASGDNYHRDSEVKTLEVSIVPWQELPGSGTPADPYTISNDLEWSIFCDMRDTSEKYFKLVDDIVVSETRQTLRGSNHPNEFDGVFDGDGHKITLYWVNNSRYGYGTSLFGRIVGHSDYYDSNQGGWHYFNATVKNLILDGIMINQDYTAPLAQSISGATVSNIISNMTLVQIGSGGDRDGAGIVHTGDLGSVNGGSHYYNIKVGGIFDNNSDSSDRKWAGITNMNDFWKSGTDFIVKDCYVAPDCRNIKVSGDNCVIMGNYKEEKSTIDNCFYGGNILDIVPVDGETGETTNTQGISDANGLAALEATGYWANGSPTMPKAVIKAKAPTKKSIAYTEDTRVPETDPETGEEIPLEPIAYPIIEGIEAENGTVWYQVNGGEWTTEAPCATEVGKYTVNYRAVGDFLHRDSDTYTSVVYLVNDWATPEGLAFSADSVPCQEPGTLTTGNAEITLSWDDNENVEAVAVYATLVKPDGTEALLIDGDIYERTSWTTADGKNTCTVLLPTLGKNDAQLFENGTVNGARFGDTIIISIAGIIDSDGVMLESVSGNPVDFMAAKGNVGKVFPVVTDGMSNDSEIQEDVIVLGDNAVLECLASGGKAPYRYEVKYKKASSSGYTRVQSYDTNQLVSFKPKAATVYDVHVNAKDTEGNVVGKDFRITVNKVLANLSEISESEIVKGESITVSADAEGGIAPYEYEVKYHAVGSSYVATAQEYGANQSVTIKPASAKDYKVTVNVRDSRGVAVTKEFDINVRKPIENTSSLSYDTIALEDTVTVNASAQYGIGSPLFAVYYRMSGEAAWKTASAYSADASVVIKPETAGDYEIVIRAKDEKNHVARKELTLKVNPPLKNSSSISENEIVLGESAVVSASAQDGVGGYMFALSIKSDGDTDWTVVSGYSEMAEYSLSPESGTYTVLVSAKDSRGHIEEKSFSLKVNPVLTNTSSLSEEEIVKGEKITVFASSEGGIGEHLYAVYYKRAAASSWTTVSDYTAQSEFVIKPAYAEDYDVVVKTKDARGRVARKAFTLKVNKVLTNTSVISSEEIIKGESITVSASGEGGIGKLRYAVFYKRVAASSWTTASGLSNRTEVVIKPAYAEDYYVVVKVKDTRGTIIKKQFVVKVNTVLTNNSSVSQQEIEAGGTVNVRCAASGGKAPYQYAVYYSYEGTGKWKCVQSYSENTDVSARLTQVGSVTIRVKLKDSTGKIVNKDIDVNVKNKPLRNTSSISAKETEAGNQISVNCDATGGENPYLYAVYYSYEGTGKWKCVQSYSENTEVSVVLPEAGSVTLRVKLKDSTGKIVNKDFDVAVKDTELRNLSTVSSRNIASGNSIDVTCAASGGEKPYLYAVHYSYEGTGKWKCVQSYSENTGVSVVLPEAGSITLRVKLKDSTGKIVNKDFAVSVV